MLLLLPLIPVYQEARSSKTNKTALSLSLSLSLSSSQGRTNARLLVQVCLLFRNRIEKQTHNFHHVAATAAAAKFSSELVI